MQGCGSLRDVGFTVERCSAFVRVVLRFRVEGIFMQLLHCGESWHPTVGLEHWSRQVWAVKQACNKPPDSCIYPGAQAKRL